MRLRVDKVTIVDICKEGGRRWHRRWGRRRRLGRRREEDKADAGEEGEKWVEDRGRYIPEH